MSTGEKTCGICFDEVLKKTDPFFGMLANCNHCFCITCIRKWRQRKDFELEIRNACPECRVVSEYVYPIKQWIVDKGKKEKYINEKKLKMKKTNCKYFKRGKGKCFFGNKCLYRHTLPNGEEFDAGPPLKREEFSDESDDEEDFENTVGRWSNLFFDMGTLLLVDFGFDNTEDDDSDWEDLPNWEDLSPWSINISTVSPPWEQ